MEFVHSYYEDTINKNVPVRPAKVNKDKPPWLNNATIKSIRRKKWHIKGTANVQIEQDIKSTLKTKETQKLIMSQKINFETKLVEDMKTNIRAF